MIHPALAPYVREAQENREPHPSTISPLERRARYRRRAIALWPDPDPMDTVTDAALALEGRTLDTRLYTPFDVDDAAIVVYFHGGSFVAGDLDTHDALCRRLAVDTRMRYLAIAYRLAPEHPFPAAVNDACDALRRVASRTAEFAGAASRILVMGESSGATLAAVAAVETRGEDLGVAAQVLIHPTMGPGMLTDSGHQYAQGFLLDVEHLRYDYRQYLGEGSDHTDPRVSPLLYGDVTGAPPAVVVVAECDPLRDEAVAYAGLLEHFGVPVELLEAKGMPHGFLRLGGQVPEALDVVDDLARHMRRFVEMASA
jgi:acetyl esterase/lipase